MEIQEKERKCREKRGNVGIREEMQGKQTGKIRKLSRKKRVERQLNYYKGENERKNKRRRARMIEERERV